MKILIVEDDALLGELLREYLQRLDHEKVQVCIMAREARRAIEEETFDCAFVDLRLPDMDGVRLLDLLKRQDPGLPVVMMSGYPTMEYTIEAMRKGASDFMTKPFTLQDVALTLERVTKERRLLLENLSLKLECQARKELEVVNRELAETIHDQKRLFQISKEIDEIRSSEDLYPCIVRLAAQLVNVGRASLFVMPPEKDNLMLIADHGLFGDVSVPRIFKLQDRMLREMLGGGADYVYVSPEDVRKELQNDGVLVSEKGALSCWPLRIRGELFGFLMTCHNGVRSCLSPTEVKLLDFLIKKSALAVENMALYESLTSNFYGILRSLVNALEAKDLYTGKHSDRVTQYATSIARKVGCSLAQIETLQTIGYLHDIGKIGIRDDILNKPGPLTREEYELVKQHPIVGESIVADLGLTSEECSIIRHHHERWDGGGYPDRLSKTDTPLLARFVSVADAYDAMTSRRSYRDPMSKGAAMEELKVNRGRQFDPDAVDAFLDVLQEKKDDEPIFDPE